VDTVNVLVADTPDTPAGAGRSGDTRSRLLACAIEILDHDGIAGLGLREVARRAGVSHNAPSRHFPGGYRELCTAVATEGFAGLAAALNAALRPGAPAMERLAANGRAYVEFGIANRGVFELMWRSDQLDVSDRAFVDAASSAYASLHDCVVAAQAAGWNADVPVDVLAATCWSWAQGLTQLWSQGALPGPIGRWTLEDLVRNGFRTLGIVQAET
jgi:AcrR family transcriptional regulator